MPSLAHYFILCTFMLSCAFLTLDAKRVLGFFSFSCLIFVYPHTQTNTHAYIPPIEWDKPLLCSYPIFLQLRKCGLYPIHLLHVARSYVQSAFCKALYLHTTDVVQQHQGVQLHLKVGFLPGFYC